MTRWPTESSVRKGDALRVRFGSNGSQYAVCIGRNRNGYPMIVKWSRRARKWSKPMRFDESAVIGKAGPHDWHKAGEPKLSESMWERFA